MKRLCFVIPSLQPGGTQRVLAELLHFIVREKEVELYLVMYGKDREVFYSIPDSVHLHKPAFEFDSGNRSYSTLKTLWYLRKQIKKINPDVILSLGEYWNSFVLLALYGLNYSLVISDRCQPDKNLGSFHELLRRWLYPKASGIIAQTETARNIYLNKSLNNNISVIGNPIQQTDLVIGPHIKENIILTVGRLIETKHHDRLIKIFKTVAASGWKLVIVGGDALKQNGMKRLKNLIEELEMEEVVELTGTISKIDAYYHKSKIFAFTSSSEGFPNVIGEAMAAGLPVIAYDCVAGPSELIDEGENGYLIPLFDDKLYSKRLEILMNNENLRLEMGKKSKEKVKKFSVENIGEQYYSFISELK